MMCPQCRDTNQFMAPTNVPGVQVGKCSRCGAHWTADYRKRATSDDPLRATIKKFEGNLSETRAILRELNGGGVVTDADLILKRLADDPMAVSGEERATATEELTKRLLPDAIARQRALHPTASVAEVQRRAAVEAADAVYELHPRLRERAPSAATLEKRRRLEVEQAALVNQMAEDAKARIAHGMHPVDAHASVLGTAAYAQYRKLVVELESLNA
jgi:hypothetical protein